MPKIAKELTVLEIKRLGQGTFAIGGVKGLYIRKTPTQTLFILRYSDATGRHDFSLGSFPETSVAAARKAAREARALIDKGGSPIEEREGQRKAKREAKEAALREVEKSKLTFEAVALEWISDRAKNGFWSKNLRGEKDTRQILARHLFPVIGSKNIEHITPEDIRTCLAPIWQATPSIAKKARTHAQKIFQWAIALHKRNNPDNPAMMSGALGVLMEPFSKNRKPKQNYAACAVPELPKLMATIHQYDSMSAQACEFAILTAARSKAVRLARWDEIDLEKGIWVVPLEHDKIKTPNRDRTIFLSSRAKKLLSKIVRYAESPYVFPSSHGSHFSDVALTMFLRGLHEKRLEEDGIGWIDPVKTEKLKKPCVITLHGTARATFRTWAKDDEIGNNRRFDQEAVEFCLLHSRNDAYNGAYDRAPLAKERRAIMEAWGEYACSYIKS